MDSGVKLQTQITGYAIYLFHFFFKSDILFIVTLIGLTIG